MGILNDIRNKNDKKYNPKYKKPIRRLIMILIGLIIAIVQALIVCAFLASVCYYCWNYVAPIFRCPQLTFLQILTLLILIEILMRPRGIR